MAAKLGSGGRFKALESKLANKPGVTNPAALAASIGRKKYGAAKFQKLAAKGHAAAHGKHGNAPAATGHRRGSAKGY